MVSLSLVVALVLEHTLGVSNQPQISIECIRVAEDQVVTSTVFPGMKRQCMCCFGRAQIANSEDSKENYFRLKLFGCGEGKFGSALFD